jgi:hypothetical protein
MKQLKCTIIIILACVFYLLPKKSTAQNMSSPYSIYGIGELDDKPYNRTSGMGNTGLAIKSSNYIIANNPASLAGLERSFFNMDIAISGKFVNFSGTPITTYNKSTRDLFSVKRFSLAAKINSFWASSIGFKNFSNVSYNFHGTKQVEGSPELYTAIYDGDGGINDFYWSNAFAVTKKLSVGIKSSILTGSIDKTETVFDDNVNSVIESKERDYYSKLRFEFGLLYSTALSKQWNISLATKLANKTGIGYERTVTVLENDVPVISDKLIKRGKFNLPNTIAFGIALKNKSGTTLAADYSFENWSNLNVKQPGYSFVNKNRVSVGAEFSKTKETYWNKKFEKRYYQFGAFAGNSYLNIRNNDINELGFTAGMGGFVSNSLSYTLAAEIGKRGTILSNLIKENYFQLSLTFSFRTFINSKGYKYN